MKKLTNTLLCIILLTSLTHSQILISAEHHADLTVNQVDSILGTQDGRFGVSIYKAFYTLLDQNDELDTVSGVILHPINAVFEPNLVVYQHGTSNTFNDCPSNFGQGFPDALSFATAGFLVGVTDYIGLGPARNSFHPYIHARTEALAGLYMITAAYELATDLNWAVGPELFVAGYSQGGHASMALQKLIETEFQNSISLTAAAHGSGPYSVSEVMRNLIISGEQYLPVGFIPFLILGYQEAYGDIYEDLTDIFDPNYVPLIQQFESGQMNLVTLSTQLAFSIFFESGGIVAPIYMLQDSIVDQMETNDGSSNIIAKLRDNDTYNFTAETPTRLYYCDADELVPFENAIFADSAMNALGASDLQAIQIDPNAGHSECARGALPMAVDFFLSFTPASTSDTQQDVLDEIYPNPVSDYLNYSISQNTSDVVFMIRDYSGKVVRVFENQDLNGSIDVSDLFSGMYLLQAISRDEMEVFPFTKQ